MKRVVNPATSLGIVIAMSIPGQAGASEETHAEKTCTDKITQIEGESNFRHVWAERLGNHKFRVHGKVVPDNGRKWIFDCEARARYDHQGHKATWTCHFDRNWRLKDSSYFLY